MDNSLRYPGKWSLDDKQLKVLQLFQQRVKEFQDYGAFTSPYEATIHATPDAINVDAEMPHEVVLRSAAMCARHFYMPKERTNFGKVCNLLYRATSEDRFHRRISEIRLRYNDLFTKKLNPSSSKRQTTKDLVDAYFNSHYFHADEDHRDFVINDSENFGPLLKQEFARTINSMRHYASELGSVVDNALGVDQLAPCPTSKEVQKLLTQQGLGPVPISIRPTSDHATNPPTKGVRCDLDLRVPDHVLNDLIQQIIPVLLGAYPGFQEYSVGYRNPAGEYRFFIRSASQHGRQNIHKRER